ncbi:MAG: hypothetical protein K2X27_19840, partial [Candidatus Obscuribacterales bacterium]|nr:hypothetical protein [Candidatus Obscuribacterales bacterium]
AISLKLSCTAAAALRILSYIYQRSAYAANLLWLHAGKEVRAVRDDAERLSQRYKNQKVLLLGVPKEHSGAHMILNGSTLQMLLSPPFTKSPQGESLLTFDPILFGDKKLVNGSRLRMLINRPGYIGPFVWNSGAKSFKALTLKSPPAEESSLNFPISADNQKSRVVPYAAGRAEYQFANAELKIESPKAGDGIRINQLHLNPLAYSYLKVSFRSVQNSIALPFQLRWRSKDDLASRDTQSPEECSIQAVLAADPQADEKTVRSLYIPVGRNWRWYTQAEINELELFVPAVKQITLCELTALSAKELAPEISCSAPENNVGAIIYAYDSPLSVETFGKGQKVILELSKQQFFFDNLEGEQAKSGIAATFIENADNAVFRLSKKNFSGSGYYQIRARSLDKNGKAIGDYSDPQTLLVN